jgi:hypothetical protein
MTKDELLKIVDANTYGASNYYAIKAAVEAYSKASNGAKPIVSGSLELLELMWKEENKAASIGKNIPEITKHDNYAKYIDIVIRLIKARHANDR